MMECVTNGVKIQETLNITYSNYNTNQLRVNAEEESEMSTPPLIVMLPGYVLTATCCSMTFHQNGMKNEHRHCVGIEVHRRRLKLFSPNKVM